MRNRSVALLLLLAAGPAALACGGDDAPPPERRSLGSQQRPAERAGLSAEVAARLDSGNAAYRAGDYEVARRHFRAAAESQPDAEAVWFGVYMAERALGNEDSARAALERAGDMGQMSDHPGGSFHPSPVDSASDPGMGGGGG